ncbi:MAG: hypothetical protein SFX74_01780 [Fimbriimonadaceae bacterium]|nr:hypothetical protein [Fimbriimonadaceae bacterium]
MRTITFLPTRVQEQVHDFWTRLGVPCVLDQGVCRIYRLAHRSYVGFCTHLEVPSPSDAVIVCLVVGTVAEVDVWHARTHHAGLMPDGAPRENASFRLCHFFVPMPDGYRLEVQAFLHPFDGDEVTTS